MGAEEDSSEDEVGQERRSEGGEDEDVEVKVRKELLGPTPKELREHMATHIPFRAWCPHCVAGKGKCQPHFRRSEEEVGTPTIAFDYMYMKSELSSRAEGAEEGREEEPRGSPRKRR